MRTFILSLCLALTSCAHLTTHTEDMKLDSECLDLTDEECLAQQGVRAKGAIKSWSSGETLHSADLNANFSHIHNNMVGGHGGRLLDADVSTSASIASSKLAAYRAIPRAWASTSTICTAGACTLAASNGVTSVTHGLTGVYTVVLNYTPTDVNFAVVVGSGGAAASAACACNEIGSAHSTTNPMITIHCWDEATPTKVDCNLSFVVFDDN